MEEPAFDELEITLAPVGSANTIAGLPCVRVIIWLITRKPL